jgi:serine phosphatase RsbU (regulator of sigma subunit)
MDELAHPEAAARRRFLTLCLVYLVLGLVSTGWFLYSDLPPLLEREAAARLTFDEAQHALDAVVALQVGNPEPLSEAVRASDRALIDAARAVRRGWGRFAGMAIALAVIGYFLLITCPRLRTVQGTTNAATRLILLMGLVLLASRLVLQGAIPNYALWGLLDLLLLHLAASLIMAWTPKEAGVPFLVLWLVWMATILVPHATELEILDRVVGVIISPLLFGPASAIAGWRTHRRGERLEHMALAGQVESFGGELSRARIVHEAMFPPPFRGHVVFEYEYQPIHEIGGDYVHANVCPETGKVTLTILDVAGHGLAAALTVNRLFGELERILAENSEAEPAEIMVLLNRYINLTMARHSLYATGTCLMLDPNTGTLKWVNAGHPPAFVRRQTRKIDELTTTTVLLGALDPYAFKPEPHATTMRPGDVVIVYTDGAFEARDPEGSRFGMDRMREIARFDPPPRDWPKFIAGAVAKHHAGQAEDDVLIASLTLHSLRVGEADAWAEEKGLAIAGRQD